MKPLWAADNEKEALEIATEALQDGEWDPDYKDPEIEVYKPLEYIDSSFETPLGIEEYITVDKYLTKYNQWLQEYNKQLGLFDDK